MTRLRNGYQSNLFLKLSENRKVSPRGTQQPGGVRPGRWVPSVTNAFSLPAGEPEWGGSCPGATPFCDGADGSRCYAKLDENNPGVRALSDHNLRLLESVDLNGKVDLLLEMLGRYRRQAVTHGLTPDERLFRWHEHGDFYSADYARAVAVACRLNPDIGFLVYTRSFRPPLDVLPHLFDSPVPNLAVYLSVDRWNAADAYAAAARWPVRLAGSTSDYDTGRALLATRDRPPLVCPENAGRLPLMDAGVGACVRCRVCFDGSRDVLFSTLHVDSAAAPVTFSPARRSPAAVGADGVCAREGCGRSLPPRAGRGAPRKWCSDSCRWAAYHSRRRVAG